MKTFKLCQTVNYKGGQYKIVRAFYNYFPVKYNLSLVKATETEAEKLYFDVRHEDLVRYNRKRK